MLLLDADGEPIAEVLKQIRRWATRGMWPVHSPWPQGGSHCIDNHFTSIYVADYLGFPLRGIRSLFQQNDRCGLEGKKIKTLLCQAFKCDHYVLHA